jgi:hypothetical protein
MSQEIVHGSSKGDSIAMLHNSITKKATKLQTLCPKVLALSIRGRLHDDACRFSCSSHNLRNAPDHVSNCTDITRQVNNKYPNYLYSLDTNNYTWALCCCTLLLMIYIYIYINFLLLFLCFRMVFNSSLFMSISKLI